MGFTRFIGGLASFLFRFLAYSFLRWLPGKQATYTTPILLLVSLLAFLLNSRSLSRATTGHKRPSLFSILVGAPSTSKLPNLFSVLLNLVIFACVIDALWVPVLGMEESGLAFVRVGEVASGGIKISARVPPPVVLHTASAVNGTEEEVREDSEGEGARVAYRTTKPLGKWIMGPMIETSEEADWMATVSLDGLFASTHYEFRLLSPSSLSHHPRFPTLSQFTTAPDPSLSAFRASNGKGSSHFTFASSSCVKPGFPYTGPAGKREVKGAQWLLQDLERRAKEGEGKALNFFLFLGDFIYADTPYWPGPQLQAYHKRYRQVFASPDMKALVQKLPMMSIYDDHEIINDFSAGSLSPTFAPANSAFQTYLGTSNPSSMTAGANYYSYQFGDAAFFVWDTRAYRSSNAMEDGQDKTMLGEVQKKVFGEWLGKVNETVTWKFVVSSTPLMTLWSHGGDTWAGFLHERDELLDIMQFVPNIIVLSGDRHEFAAASIRNTITEFSTSPLNQFYLPVRTLSQSHGRGPTGEDVLLKYLPDGNSKFSTFEVDTRNASRPLVRVRVVIDGDEAWSLDVVGRPLTLPPVGNVVGGLGKSLMELLGFKNRKWF